ncbi:MAG TPA: tetratricopeptide repeat protein [Bryobacteraceae bacterium]|nr:tetratricopeptide repeat protein [Bryobacteraceae bacterium]
MFIGFALRRVAALLTLLIFLPLLRAQSPVDSDSQVQQLHSEARSAESRGDFAGAAAKYESILKIAPDLAVAYNNLGALYFKQRRYGKAAAILKKGLKLDPHMTSASALLGMALFETGSFQDARPHLEAALRAHPQDNNIELFLANDLTKIDDFEAAAFHLQQLVKREPEDQHAWYLLGKVYTQLARQALAKMNAIDPHSVWAHEVSGEIMESMKNYDGALIEYKKAIEVAPRQPGAHYKLGDLYWSLSQWDNATAQFKAELANDPGNCMAQWKIGDILVQQSIKPEEALAEVNKALAMCPNLTEARLDRGRLLLRLHRVQDALTDLKIAEKATPNDPAVHFSLAQAYRALGQAGEARAELDSFRKLDAAARAAAADQAQQAIKNEEIPH